MRKSLKRFLIPVLALVLVVSSVTVPAKAADGEYLVFVAMGADVDDSVEPWEANYEGPDNAATNVGDVTAVTAMAKDGDTVTVSLTIPVSDKIYWCAPVVVIDSTLLGSNASFDTKVKIDGKDITKNIDWAAGDAYWAENVGTAYAKESTIRLAGGYNEWGAKYITEFPAGFTTIEYTITLNLDLAEVAATDAAATDAVPTTGDTSVVFIIGVVALLSLAGTVVVSKRRRIEA